MFNLSSSNNICVSQVFKLSSQQKFRLQRIISRGDTRRQVILVLTDTTGGVLSRVWKTTFTKHRLDPYYDKSDQSLLVGGRFQSSISAIKHLIILPQGHPVVDKIIQSVTRKLLHSGPESALSVLWQEIWLIKGRREVKSVLGKCLVCQRPRVDQCSQKMEPLPLGSELSSPAFTHVGINFAGPLFVWGSPPQPRLMISRRGLCKSIWSDNAKTFKSADRQLQQLFTQESSADRRRRHKIDQEGLQDKLTFWESNGGSLSNVPLGVVVGERGCSARFRARRRYPIKSWQPHLPELKQLLTRSRPFTTESDDGEIWRP